MAKAITIAMFLLASALLPVASAEGHAIVTSADALAVKEGRNVQFAVSLSEAPTEDVVVALEAAAIVEELGGPAMEETPIATVSPSEITFTAANFDRPVSVTVTPHNDGVYTGGSEFMVMLMSTSADEASSGLEAEVLVAVTDDDTPEVDLAIEAMPDLGGALELRVGAPFTLTVTASHDESETDAANVEVRVKLPKGAALDGEVDAGDSCDALLSMSNKEVVCKQSLLAIEETIVITIPLVAPSSAGIAKTKATVSAAGETDRKDNTHNLETEVTPDDVDLSVEAAGPEGPLYAGEDPFTVTFTVANAGEDAATDATLTVTVPPKLTAELAEGAPDITCDAMDNKRNIVCELGEVALDAIEVPFDFAGATTPNTFVFKSSVAAAEKDLNTRDNRHQLKLKALQAGAELSIDTEGSGVDEAAEEIADAAPLAGGAEAVVTVAIDNAGPLDADNVVVKATLPRGVSLSEDGGAGSGCTQKKRVVTCVGGEGPLGVSGEDGTLEVTFGIMLPAKPGDYSVSVSVSSEKRDNVKADNSATLAFTVDAPEEEEDT